MGKHLRKIFAVLLAICICAGAAPQALAATFTETGTEGGITTTTVTTTGTTEDGASKVTIKINKEGTYDNGAKIEHYEEIREIENRYTETPDGYIKDYSWKVSGKEVFQTTKVPNTTVIVPGTNVDDPATEEIENQNSSTVGDPAGTTGEKDNLPEGEDNGNKTDVTTSVVEQQGKVTVTTTEVSAAERTEGEYSDLEHFRSDLIPNKDNDIFHATGTLYDPDAEIPEAKEGYQFVYMGSDATSQYYAAILYTDPGYEGEVPAFTDENGNNYYTHRGALGGSYLAEGVYLNGEKVSEGSVSSIWANVTQYVLVDSKTGEVITTYCADLNTPCEDGYSYQIKNIEDATYYSEEQAAMLRTVAKNGFWGIKDDPETEVAENGSFEAMQAMMRGALDENGERIFSEEEVLSLTEGVALTATQYAVWTFSNYFDDVEFINVHHIQKNANNEAYGYGAGSLKDVPADKKDSVDLLFKLYDYLINMEPTSFESKTTSDTIINEENNIKDVSITVIGKDETHVNNHDDDDTNDAYITDLSFALVVEPSGSDSEKLLITILDLEGNVKMKCRIAGVPESDDEVVLVADKNGNYTIKGIVMVEGEKNINISIEGVQYLEEGVYLYTSEVRDVDGEDVSSQTMIGIASGKREINVNIDLKFELNVDEEIIVYERTWSDEYEERIPYEEPPERTPPPPENPPEDPPTPPENPPENPPEPPDPSYDPPETETIIDEDVPLADVPGLGDESAMWMLVAAFAIFGLAVINLPERKRENN